MYTYIHLQQEIEADCELAKSELKSELAAEQAKRLQTEEQVKTLKAALPTKLDTLFAEQLLQDRENIIVEQQALLEQADQDSVSQCELPTFASAGRGRKAVTAPSYGSSPGRGL